MIALTDLIVEAVQDFDMRIELDVLGSADAIPIGRERPNHGPSRIELVDEVIETDKETQLSNKLPLYELSDAVQKKDAFQGLENRRCTNSAATSRR